jgi:hypothetical protein
MLKPIVCISLFLSLPSLCQAEVSGSSDAGFTVTQAVTTKASVKRAWQGMMGHIDQWWHPDHTWSGDAGNLYIKPRIGGCFCERLEPRGEVEHLRIIYINPGALGPLQSMAAQGRMIWKVDPAPSGSTITLTYMVSGWVEGGFTPIAPAVDGVLKQQMERLAGYLDQP